jgi:Protein of unknown function (DUF1214)
MLLAASSKRSSRAPPSRTCTTTDPRKRNTSTQTMSQGNQLNGDDTYAIIFAKGEVPPVKGFWSLTLYDAEHFFHPNPLNRYSLGTKNKTLKYNTDGSLTLYAGAKSPGADKESNWLPAPNGPFSPFGRTRPFLMGSGNHPRQQCAVAQERGMCRPNAKRSPDTPARPRRPRQRGALSSHYQLRHLISVPAPACLFLAQSRHAQCADECPLWGQSGH